MMKSPKRSSVLLLSLLATTVSSQLLVLPAFLKQPARDHAAQNQAPISNVPGVVMPPSSNNDNDDDTVPNPDDQIMMSDVIGKERAINVFAGFTRDIASVSKRLEDGTQNVTVLAPLNSVLMKLPRKPWEDPREYETLGEMAYEGKKGEDRAHANLRRFVEAHVVPVSPWKENEKVETLDGGRIWYETKGSKKLIQPGDVEVESVPNKVANGELWVLKGIVNYLQ